MAKKRVHIRSVVNAAAVSKTGSTYTIRDVCGAVDEIVMNGRLYPAEQLAAGAPTLEGKPAPAGHPRDASGRAISALNGDALLTSYIGAVCRNARHEGGRTLVDVVVNEKQARAHPDGAKLADRLDAALNGTNSEPIHVSTGILLEEVTANGESRGKPYTSIATNLQYDHLAILLNERGAGTPDEGVGLFLNADGTEQPIESVDLPAGPEDKRSAGWRKTLWRLIGNGSTEVSFDQITSGLYALMPEGAWLRDVFDRYAVWSDRDGKLWKQDYSVASDGSVAFSGHAVQVERKVEYQPVTNHEVDPVKETIVAALNAAGISGVAAMTDAQLLAAFEALKAQPHVTALNAEQTEHAKTKAKLAEFEVAANAARDAELTALATELATNSSLTAADFKAMGLARCKELKAKAAPVVVGNAAGGAGDDPYANYSINEIATGKKEAA